ncbi:MAG TPA: T9SS type A sorting domain-containing protein [Bacteroidales bacterium]|nr:T9SS type A sorting domain-containing protein [Bacteroidales bacterium]HPS16135.1 T9SS type A sorting domain-containing protein [Bacteroidales bacterium]
MKNFTFFLISIIITFTSNAQCTINTGSFKSPHTDGTMQYLQWMMQQSPTLQKKMQIEEEKFNDYIRLHHNEFNTNKNSYVIPVVVHIVYKNSSENITDERVAEQIAQTNIDFAGLNSHSMEQFSNSLKANTGITFCLATADPDGNPTTGITRTQTTVTSFGTDNKVKNDNTGGKSPWEVSKYLNIWVCNLGNGLSGYGQFPTSGINNKFGLVVNYQFFGITGTTFPYNLGATTTHELGHCFNLFHVVSADSSCTDNDLCPDTPNQLSYPVGDLSGCITDYCTDTCPGIMYMNFMGYSDDAEMTNFTPNQSERMQAAIDIYLSSIASSAVTSCSGAGINEILNDNDFFLYPNPASNSIIIENKSSKNKMNILLIYNTQGKPVLQKISFQPATTIDISELSEGMYFLKIKNESQIIMKKFIKE